MVFNPTRQRQYKIRPVGIAPMTGLRQLGESSNFLAQTSRDIQDDANKKAAAAESWDSYKLAAGSVTIDEKTGRYVSPTDSSLTDWAENTYATTAARKTLLGNVSSGITSGINVHLKSKADEAVAAHPNDFEKASKLFNDFAGLYKTDFANQPIVSNEIEAKRQDLARSIQAKINVNVADATLTANANQQLADINTVTQSIVKDMAIQNGDLSNPEIKGQLEDRDNLFSSLSENPKAENSKIQSARKASNVLIAKAAAFTQAKNIYRDIITNGGQKVDAYIALDEFSDSLRNQVSGRNLLDNVTVDDVTEAVSAFKTEVTARDRARVSAISGVSTEISTAIDLKIVQATTTDDIDAQVKLASEDTNILHGDHIDILTRAKTRRNELKTSAKDALTKNEKTAKDNMNEIIESVQNKIDVPNGKKWTENKQLLLKAFTDGSIPDDLRDNALSALASERNKTDTETNKVITASYKNKIARFKVSPKSEDGINLKDKLWDAFHSGDMPLELQSNWIAESGNVDNQDILWTSNRDMELIGQGRPHVDFSASDIRQMVEEGKLPKSILKPLVAAEMKGMKILWQKDVNKGYGHIVNTYMPDTSKPDINVTPDMIRAAINKLESEVVNVPLNLKQEKINSLKSKLKTYAEKWTELRNDTVTIQDAVKQAANGRVLNQTQEAVIEKRIWKDTVVNYDDKGSMKNAVSFINKYGFVPANLREDFFNSVGSGNEEQFQNVMKVLRASVVNLESPKVTFGAAKRRVFSSVYKAASQGQGSLYNVKAVIDLTFMGVPFTEAKDMAHIKNSTSGNSKLKGIGGFEKLTEDGLKQAVFNQFKDGVDNGFVEKFIRSLFGKDSIQARKIMQHYETTYGVDAMDVIFADPDASNLLYKAALNEFGENVAYQPNIQDFRAAMLTVASDFKGIIGFASTVDPVPIGDALTRFLGRPLDIVNNPATEFIGFTKPIDNVVTRLVINPITDEFKQTLPVTLHGENDMPYYQSDIRDIFNALPDAYFTARRTTRKRAMEAVNGGHMYFSANRKFGDVRGYRVTGKNADGDVFDLLDNYHPDWNQMEASKAWGSITTDGVNIKNLYQFKALSSLVGLPVMKAAMSNFLETNEESFHEKTLQFVNERAALFGVAPREYSPETKQALRTYLMMFIPPSR